MKEIAIGNARVQLMVGDITAQDTDAVVNAANKQLAPGGGVAGAIHKAAGPKLWQECATLGGCQTGEARISGAYNLPNRYVIHTVGPVYSASSSDPVLLKSCYINSLKLADQNKVQSIAFPALSTGIFGYPVYDAALVALQAISEYLQGDSGIELVRMVLYNEADYNTHVEALKKIQAG